MRSAPYSDRADAGRALADALAGYAGTSALQVLALPRGGVPVAAVIASTLHAPLDVLLVRKLGLPSHRELAMGAVAAIGDDIEVVRNERVLLDFRVGEDVFDDVLADELAELQRRQRDYRGQRLAPALAGATVILVDDGLATGATMRAAAHALTNRGPRQVVVAVPVGAPDTCRRLAEEVDELVCPYRPDPFFAVGNAYRDFSQTSDEEVRQLLADAESPA